MDAAEAAARTAEHTHFTDGCVWSGVTQKDRKGWLKMRRNLVTASGMAILLGVDPWRDPLDLYADMTRAENDVEYQDDVDSLHDPMFWGRELEQTIARAVGRHHNCEVFEGGALLISKQHPRIGATLDDEFYVRDSGRWIVYEGKTVVVSKSKDWDEEAQMPPDHVFIQGQTQLLVTQAPEVFIFALVGGNTPKQVHLHPDPELHNVMVEAVEEFIDRCNRLEPPPPTARSDKALSLLYPNENGSTVELSAEALEWTREWLELGPKLKELEARRDLLRNQIKASLGDASYGRLPGLVGEKSKQWKCETRSVAEHTVAEWSKRVLCLVNDNQKTAESKERASPTSISKSRRRARRV